MGGGEGLGWAGRQVRESGKGGAGFVWWGVVWLGGGWGGGREEGQGGATCRLFGRGRFMARCVWLANHPKATPA